LSLPIALSVAGSDPSGGAGIQADLKTFAAHGVYGMAVITALTAQNTRTVAGVLPIDSGFIRLQLATLLDDILPGAIKVGMLGTADIAAAVAEALANFAGPIVVDPVMVSTSGALLLDPAAESALLGEVIPRATLLTPNLPEAERILGDESPAEWARRSGVALLLKDGHNDGRQVRDRLFLPDGAVLTFAHPRVLSRNTHGTGCTLSSAVAARLSAGNSLPDAVHGAIQWLSEVIADSASHAIGGGHGPLLHGRGLRETSGRAPTG